MRLHVETLELCMYVNEMLGKSPSPRKNGKGLGSVPKPTERHRESGENTPLMKRLGSTDRYRTFRYDTDTEESSIHDDSRSESVSSFFNFPTSTPRTVPYQVSSDVSLKRKICYYIPCYSWIKEYKLEYFGYDLLAGWTLASYQIPLSMSFATAVAHVPTSSGLLGLTIGPMVYSLLGTVPQMIVGPEAAVSMIIGQCIERTTKHDPSIDPVDVLCNLTFLSGLILFTFGILRFGFLDNVLCGTLLKGFITAIGLSMILNSCIAILGLEEIMENLPPTVHVHSAIEKFLFLVHYWREYHRITAIVGILSFLNLLFLGFLKKKLIKKKFKKVSYFPEILFTIILFTIFSYALDFEGKEVSVIGEVSLDNLKLKNPFSSVNRAHWGELFPIAFACAILGFFETSTAGKSLSSTLETPVSSNRELVSLGVVGSAVSLFGALPAFGGYSRSKLNAVLGAKSPVSGLCMGLTTLFVTFKMLNSVYYLPICVLNSVIAVVGWKMVEETPSEIKFHIRTRGINELVTFVVTLLASLYYSIEIGVALGCFYSLMRVLKHSTQSRVQILTRVAGTDTFVNPDARDTSTESFPRKIDNYVVPGYKEFRRQSIIGYQSLANVVEGASSEQNAEYSLSNTELKNSDIFPKLEDREGCIIVKIAEPLTFFNANDMRARLKRIELYGSTAQHPGAKSIRKELRHIVFDLHGMTSIDSSATKTFYELIEGYHRRGINVFFTRLFKSNHLFKLLKDSGIQELLSEVDGEEFGIHQTRRPYYDSILDALKAIDKIDATCDWETHSIYSTIGID